MIAITGKLQVILGSNPKAEISTLPHPIKLTSSESACLSGFSTLLLHSEIRKTRNAANHHQNAKALYDAHALLQKDPGKN